MVLATIAEIKKINPKLRKLESEINMYLKQLNITK